MARSYFGWPALDEAMVMEGSKCDSSNSHAKRPEKGTIPPMEVGYKPWQKLHVDFAEQK